MDHRPSSRVSLLLASAIAVAFFLPGVSADEAIFRHYTVEDGLSQSQVETMLQDDDGYLWLGTQYGLSRFDGLHFRTFTTRDGLLANRITASFKDHQGRLWFGHATGGLSRWDGSRFETFPPPELGSPGTVKAIAADEFGTLWVATEGNGLQRIKREGVLERIPVEAFPLEIVNGLIRRGNLLWAATERGIAALSISSPGASSPEPLPRFLLLKSGVSFTASALDSHGDLWFGTERGELYACGSSDPSCERLIGPFESSTPLPPHPIRAILPVAGSEGDVLWVASFGGGLIKLQPRLREGRLEISHLFSTADGLSFVRFLSAMKDREGNLWFGTDGRGVSLYRPSPFSVYMRSSNPLEAVIWEADQDPQGNLWFGSQGGLLRLPYPGDRGGGVSSPRVDFKLRQADGLPSSNIRGVHVGKGGCIWLATDGGGLVRYDPRSGAIDALSVESGLPTDRLLGLTAAPDGSLWFGMLDHGVGRYLPPASPKAPLSRGRLELYRLRSGKTDTSVYDVFVARGGGVWITSSDMGLGHFIPAEEKQGKGVFVFYGRERGLEHPSLNSIDQDSKGRLWIATDDGGVYYYDRGRFTNISEGSRVSRENVYLIACTENDRVLVGTNNGLYRWDGIPGAFTHFGKEEGFGGLETNVHAVYKDRLGYIWFGTVDGAVRYNSFADRRNTIPPKVHVTGMQILLEPIELHSNMVLKYNQNHVTFDFIGISTSAPEKVRYRFKLEGFDRDWMAATDRTSATYSNLPSGDFTFLVKATNADGVTSPVPAAVSFRISTPYWRTWWFYAISAFLAGTMVYGVFRYQVRNIERRNRELETSVLERTRDLRAHQEHLKKANEALQKALHDARQAAQAKAAFLATMSHEIRTPMNGVLGMAELLMKTDLNGEQTEYAEIIHSSGSALLSIINDVLDLSKIEAGRISLEAIAFDCRETVSKVIALMAPRAAKKNLELACVIAAGVPETVVGDPHRLRQVLTNLIGNAIKFTKTGQVVVRVGATAAGEREQVRLRFKIEDSGIGINEKALAGVFEPFSQEDSSFARRFGGTGLGLAICRHLVERMGGAISVSSRVGRGSCFSFDIVFGGVLESAPERPLQGRHILLLDENTVVRGVLREQLEEAGAEVVEIESTSALAAYRGDGDWALLSAGPDGEHAASRIAAMGAHRQLHSAGLVMMFPFGVDPPEGTCEAHERCHRVTKPIHFRRLCEILHSPDSPGQEPQRPAPAPPTAGRPWDTTRVLVVDDNRINLKVAERMLVSLGCTVDLAVSGKECLERLERSDYDLVFMDCQMPEMDGFESTRRIRESDGENRRIPIVALTANAMEGDRDQCLASGMDDYLAKPIRQEQVRAILERWLVPV